MAFSSTLVRKGILGDMSYEIYNWTAGGDASGVIAANVGTMLGAFAANSENFAEAPRVQVNTGASGTLAGSVKLTFADATNNTGQVMVLGYSF